MGNGSMQAPVIRTMTMKDLSRIIEIDTRILGKSRPDYWEAKLFIAEHRSPLASLVAEIGGTVIGFIIGDASGWEYGAPENVGWIYAIGVDPEYQRKGIAKMLITEMVDNLKKVGVDTVYTFVNWRDWKLLRFFNSKGFRKGEMISLELKV